MYEIFIGVDLGAWYGNKTRIAVCEVKNNKLELINIEKEPTSKKEDYTKRDEELIKQLKELSANNAIIAIDAPFSIPYYLYNSLDKTKQIYNPNDIIKRELANPLMFDDSARFVYEKTNQRVLAPAGDKIGRLTARMIHIFNNKEWYKFLNPITNPNYDTIDNQIKTIEVYPRATLKILLKDGDIPQYKSKKSDDYFKNESGRKKMLDILDENDVEISQNLKEQIETDDDYDAIICALTAYLVDTKGYLKPENIDKNENEFTNSFIYMPNIGD